MCRLNRRNAYYKASTETQIQHKNSTNTQNKKTNKQKKTVLHEKLYKSTGKKQLHSEETQISLFENVPVQRKMF
jgi:hypothetical protein